MTELPLFEAKPRPRLRPGDIVQVQLMWGTERATVLNVRCCNGFLVVDLHTAAGHEVTVTPARIVLTHK